MFSLSLHWRYIATTRLSVPLVQLSWGCPLSREMNKLVTYLHYYGTKSSHRILIYRVGVYIPKCDLYSPKPVRSSVTPASTTTGKHVSLPDGRRQRRVASIGKGYSSALFCSCQNLAQTLWASRSFSTSNTGWLLRKRQATFNSLWVSLYLATIWVFQNWCLFKLWISLSFVLKSDDGKGI